MLTAEWPECEAGSSSGSCDDTNISSDNNTAAPACSSPASAAGGRSCQQLVSSWTWSEQPSWAQLDECLEAVVAEQSCLVREAATTTLSSVRLRQRLTVLQRHLTAVSRSAHKSGAGCDVCSKRCVLTSIHFAEDAAVSSIEQSARTAPGSKRPPRAPPEASEQAAAGLARVGSRAALSFAFAFLRRAWRSGEDQDLCSELLAEALEALQALPEASLFHTEAVSKVGAGGAGCGV